MLHVFAEDRKSCNNHNTALFSNPSENFRKMSSPISPEDRSQQIREKLEHEFHCSHHDRAIAIKKQKNGVRYCYQCQRCGEIEMLRAGDLTQR